MVAQAHSRNLSFVISFCQSRRGSNFRQIQFSRLLRLLSNCCGDGRGCCLRLRSRPWFKPIRHPRHPSYPIKSPPTLQRTNQHAGLRQAWFKRGKPYFLSNSSMTVQRNCFLVYNATGPAVYPSRPMRTLRRNDDYQIWREARSKIDGRNNAVSKAQEPTQGWSQTTTLGHSAWPRIIHVDKYGDEKQVCS